MKKYLPILILAGCVAAFIFGVDYLFQLRFEAGDVYPPYSSLRADPLGAMAFYESLEKVPGLSVRRDFSATDKLPEEPQTVYLHLAGNRYEWEWVSPDLYQNLEHFLGRGGRLVVTFFPQTEGSFFEDEGTNSAGSKRMTESKSQKSGKKDEDKNDNKEETRDEDLWVPLEDRWGFHTDFQKLEPDGDSYAPATVFNQTSLSLPDTLAWHSGIVFTNLSHSWRVIYGRGQDAVVIEIKFGRGSVVIATDSYFVSNEALTKDRHADFLAWLVGSNKNVVFDEAHFGIVETSGVATLMRKYRLHGLAAGLLLLAGLFIWKNSLSLVPPLDEEKADPSVAGKGSASGFVNLLRRNIAPRDLLAICFAEWKKTATQNGKSFSPRFQRAEAVFVAENSQAGKNAGPVGVYRKISETLSIQNQKL
jgi:hypothetical protein